MSEVLRPDAESEAWNEFVDALWLTLGLCHGAEPGKSQARFYFAERLLEARGYDVEASLALYEKRGGHCDCEILFNVDPMCSDGNDAG